MSRFFENPGTFQHLEKGIGPEPPPPIVTVETLRDECKDNPLLEDLLNVWLTSAERYTEWVAAYELALEGDDDKEELARLSESRGRIHDGFISNTQVLARNLDERGKNGEWIDELRDDRSRYAVLAIKTAYRELKRFFDSKTNEGAHE